MITKGAPAMGWELVQRVLSQPRCQWREGTKQACRYRPIGQVSGMLVCVVHLRPTARLARTLREAGRGLEEYLRAEGDLADDETLEVP